MGLKGIMSVTKNEISHLETQIEKCKDAELKKALEKRLKDKKEYVSLFGVLQ